MQPGQLNRKEDEWQYRSIFDAAIDALIIIDLETGRVVEANPAACRMHGSSFEDFIGLPLTDFIYPDSKDKFDEYLQLYQTDGVLDALVSESRQDGSLFYAEWRGSAFTFRGRPCLIGIVRDVSDRVQTKQLLDQQIMAHSREQATLLEISRILAANLEFHPNLVLDQLREIIEYNNACLFALEDSTLVTLAMRGTPKINQSSPVRIHVKGTETLETLFSDHQPIRIGDIWSEDPQAQLLRLLLDDGAAKLLVRMKSWMWVPLAVKNRIIGGLGVAHELPHFFTSHHADLALSVANQAAITMTNMELYQKAQALAKLEERQRLARNLHDAINQSLFSAGLIAEVLPRLWERDPAEARKSIDDLLRLTRGAQAEMRALLAELRPSTLTDSYLGDLLHLLGNAFSSRTNLPVTIIGTGDFILPSEVQLTFYRVCQETLNNIARHSNANNVEIILKQERPVTEMRIRDDGQGFDPQKISTGHYGLSMMRERAEEEGAILTITSQPGHGTEVAIHWTSPPPKEDLW